MLNNPITDEIRRIRHELADQFSNDLHRIVEDLRLRQKASERKVVRFPKRIPKTQHKENQVV